MCICDNPLAPICVLMTTLNKLVLASCMSAIACLTAEHIMRDVQG